MASTLHVRFTYIVYSRCQKLQICLLKNKQTQTNKQQKSKSTLKGILEVTNPIKDSLTNKIRIEMNKMPTKVFTCKNKRTSSRMHSKQDWRSPVYSGRFEYIC